MTLGRIITSIIISVTHKYIEVIVAIYYCYKQERRFLLFYHVIIRFYIKKKICRFKVWFNLLELSIMDRF